MTPESPGAIRRNIIRRLGLASQVAEAIRSPKNNIRVGIYQEWNWGQAGSTNTMSVGVSHGDECTYSFIFHYLIAHYSVLRYAT